MFAHVYIDFLNINILQKSLNFDDQKYYYKS
jgi:hypothetical protein